MTVRIGARGFPIAERYEVFRCTDPHCGPHFLAMDADGVPICEVVFNEAMIAELQLAAREETLFQ